MMTTTFNLKLRLALTATLFLTAACSAGSLPDNMNDTVAASVSAPAPLPLNVSLNATAINVGASSTISISGGTLPYQITSSSGSLSTGVLNSAGAVIFTGSAGGIVNVVVSDALAESRLLIITVTAVTQPQDPQQPQVPEVSRETRNIYLSRQFYMTDDGVTAVSGVISRLSVQPTAPAGFTMLGRAYSLFVYQVPGSVALNQCIDPSGQTFESRDSGCEGRPLAGVLGYLYPPENSSVAGTVALNRYIYHYQDHRADRNGIWYAVGGGHVDHRTTTNGMYLEAMYGNDGPAYLLEGTLGYAPAN